MNIEVIYWKEFNLETNELESHIVDMVQQDRSKADQLFDLFYDKLLQGKDHSQASKEQVSKALELKIEASKNIIEVLKVQQKQQQNNLIMSENTQIAAKDINIANIKKALEQ